jgi:hypothetical protein
MLGTETTVKHGRQQPEAFHQNQDFVVTITAVNVVTGQFQTGLLLQYLKCGAVAHLEQVAVAVWRAIQETVALTQLNQQM